MSHYYKGGVLVPEGTPGALPSVTTILSVRDKPFLREWRLRVGEEAAAAKTLESTTKGTAVHQMIETYINDGEYQIGEDDPLYPYFRGYLTWEAKAKPEKVQSEIYLESLKYGYCGTTDIICYLDGELWVLDLKTSKQMSDEMGLQLAAYAQAYYEKTKKRARTAILQLTDQTVKGYRFKEYEGNLDIFLAHKAIFDWQTPKEKVDTRITF